MGWFLLLAGSVILLPLLAVCWLWSGTRYDKIAVAATFSCLVGASYLYFHAPDAYYRIEFEHLTGVPFPMSGKMAFSDTSTSVYSTYRSCAVFRVSAEDYDALKQVIVARQSENAPTVSDRCSERMAHSHGKSMGLAAHSHHIEPGDFLQWGLLDDGTSVSFYVFRWKVLNPV